MQRQIIAGAVALVLGGCAGELEMRGVARQSSAILTDYRTSVRAFAAGQTALNAANESNLDQLARLRDVRQAEISARVSSWKLGADDYALRRFSAISEAGAAEVLANAAPWRDTPPPPDLALDSAQIDAVIKQLVELQRPVSLERRLGDLVDYGTAVRKTYRKGIADAAIATEQAADEAEAQAAEIINQIASEPAPN